MLPASVKQYLLTASFAFTGRWLSCAQPRQCPKILTLYQRKKEVCSVRSRGSPWQRSSLASPRKMLSRRSSRRRERKARYERGRLIRRTIAYYYDISRVVDHVKRIQFIIRVHRRMSLEQRQLNIVVTQILALVLRSFARMLREKISKELKQLTSRD